MKGSFLEEPPLYSSNPDVAYHRGRYAHSWELGSGRLISQLSERGGEEEWGVPKQMGEWTVLLSHSAESGVIPALRNVAKSPSGGQREWP